MPDSAIERPAVLLVEDEFLIRVHAAEVIREAGFEVIEAINADEAIVILDPVETFECCSPTSRCRARWTD